MTFQIETQPFQAIKTTNSKRGKICSFLKGVSPWFWSKICVFLPCVFQIKQVHKRSFMIFQIKNQPFKTIKITNKKEAKFAFLLKDQLVYGFGQKFEFFYSLFLIFCLFHSLFFRSNTLKKSFMMFYIENQPFQTIKIPKQAHKSL